MQLDGIHHITCITADAPGNVDFYARVLGLRLVKKTVNFDAPDVYHLYYGDERGTPGSILTFFEFPGAAPGRAGAGMIHRLRWRVGSNEALGFWAERLAREGAEFDRSADERYGPRRAASHRSTPCWALMGCGPTARIPSARWAAHRGDGLHEDRPGRLRA